MNIGNFDSFHFEVKDTRGHDLQALGEILNNFFLKFHLELNFNNFEKQKEGKDYNRLLQHSHNWN